MYLLIALPHGDVSFHIASFVVEGRPPGNHRLSGSSKYQVESPSPSSVGDPF
jgi:hypothetical protein